MPRRRTKEISIYPLVVIAAICYLLFGSCHMHSFSDWTVLEQATCTEEGLQEGFCECGKKKTQIIEAIGHSYKFIEDKSATCTEQGSVVKICTVCDYSSFHGHIDALGHNMKESSRIDNPDDENVIVNYQCTRCEESSSKTFVRGSKDMPYVLDADTWYAEHCAGTSQTKYLGKYVKVCGRVLYFDDTKSYTRGLYLVGGPGKGLVCWVDSDELDAKCGQYVELVGMVSREDPSILELQGVKIEKAKWPTEKLKSPVIVDDWIWYTFGSKDRDVYFSWRFINNTDKTIKHITIEWYCHSNTGGTPISQIMDKQPFEYQYVGVLEAGQSTDAIRYTSYFSHVPYDMMTLTKLIVEFEDGTTISISSQGYYDYFQPR